MKKRIHVRPVPGGWAAIEQTDLQGFFMDWRYSGLRVAVENVFWLMGLMAYASGDDNA